MKFALKKNTAAEDDYVRDLARTGPLQKVARGEARVISKDEYPDPIKRFLSRERSVVHVKLSPAARRRLERISIERGVSIDELARNWVEQGIEREAG